MSTQELFKTLIENYMEDVPGTLAVAICDRDGLIIASEGRSGTSEDIMGVISASLDIYIDRIKNEFGAESSFFNITSTGEKKFAFFSKGSNAILTTIAETSTNDVQLKVYSEHIAGKIELIIEGNENVTIKIPAIIKALSKTRRGILPKGEFSTKLIITGDYKVGKTSLIKRFVEQHFSESYISTIGVEISKKTLQLGPDTLIRFLLWDIGGQRQEMMAHRARFYNGANAAFITLDRTRANTLASIKLWYDDIKKSVPLRIPIVIVGNKSDLEDQLTISEEDISKTADEYGFHYIFTSCKTGENVDDAFLYIAYRFLETV